MPRGAPVRVTGAAIVWQSLAMPRPGSALVPALALAVALTTVSTAGGGARSAGAASATLEQVPSGCTGSPAATETNRNQPPEGGPNSPSPTVAPLAGPIPAPTVASTALLHYAESDLAAMASSRYAHRSLRYPNPTRTYVTDCSGFASFLVNQTSAASQPPTTAGGSFAPMSDLVTVTSGRPDRLGPGSQPRALADQFAELFGALAEHVVGPDRFWAGYTTVDQLEPGDLIAWVTNPGNTSSDTGHVMVAAGRPTLGPTIVHQGGAACGGAPTVPSGASGPVGGNYTYVCPGRPDVVLYEYDVAIIDQSGPHGPGLVPGLNATPPSEVAPGADTRNANPKNGATGPKKPHTGLGAGVLGLLTDEPGGTPLGAIWYPSGSSNPVFYVMPSGRPTCPAGSVVPRKQEMTELLKVHHLGCIPGIAFGELQATA